MISHAAIRLERLRWCILGLLFCSTVIYYVDRQALSVRLPILRGELGLSSADYGTITAVFMLAYAVAQIPSAAIAGLDALGGPTRRSVSPSLAPHQNMGATP